MERKPLYQFSEWFVSRLGELVREAYRISETEFGVERSEARRSIKLAFEILGKRQEIKITGLNIKLGKK